MSGPVTVEIVAKDGSSAVFRKISGSATEMGTTLEATGKKGSRSFDDLGKSAQRNTSLVEELRNESTELGAAFGAVISVVSLAGAAYREQERTIDGIERAYGDASDTILDMTEDIQDLTRYSNDAARESALMASSLANNYDLSADSISALIERSADLAQIFGISLPDAVQRTSAALRGEGESAEALSLNMSDAAIAARALDAGISNWNVPGALSEAEKAAFRFEVLMSDSAYAAGAAGDAAANAGGGFRQLANEAQDAVQWVGGLLGPVGSVAAEMAPLAIAAPVVGAGLANVGRSALLARAGMGALALATNPIALGLAGITAAGAIVVENMQRQGEAAENYTESLVVLGDTLEWLRLQGEGALADIGEGLMDDVDNAVAMLDNAEMGALSFYESLDLARQKIDPTTFSNILIDDFDRAIDAADNVNLRISEALRNPDVDHSAYTSWVDEMLASIEITAEGSNIDEVMERILTRPLSDFREEIELTAEAVKASITDVQGIFADLGTTIDDLRIDGQGQLAADIEGLGIALEEAFAPDYQAMSTDFMDPAFAALAEAKAETAQITEEMAESVEGAWDRISGAMASGNLDNAAIMSDVNAILQDTTLSAEEQAAAIVNLSQNMSQYVDVMAEVKSLQVDWIADGERILEFWAALDQAILNSSGGIATAGDAWTQFRETFDVALETDQLNDSFDQVLRIFDQIDQLGKRPSAAGAIADHLFGEGGDPYDAVGPLRDVYDAGRISVEQFNATIVSGIAIQESAAQSQLVLNEIRADQLPLLEAEQSAYVANLEAIAALEPAEQRRVLMLQDTAVQTQIADLYSQAYAASIGQIPETVATDMILNATDADAGLKDLLLQMGLISEVDGEIRVNFPGADETIQAIDKVTGSVLLLADLLDNNALDGSINLSVEGDAELNELYGHLLEVDDTEANASVNIESTGTGVEDLKEVQLADGTVVTVKTEVDTGGWENLTAAELAREFAIPEEIPLPVEAVLQPMDGVTEAEWNAMIGPFPEVTIPVGVQVATAASGDGTGGAQNWEEMLGVPDDVTIGIIADTIAADTALQTTAEQASGLDGQDSTVIVNADIGGAVDNMASAAGQLASMQGDASTVFVEGDNSAAIGAMNTASIHLAGIDGSSALFSVLGDNDDAMGAINEVARYAGASLGTAVFNVVTAYSSTGTPGPRSAFALGGTIWDEMEPPSRWGVLPTAANGRTVLVGEAGPELVNLPHGSQVTPHVASMSQMAAGGGGGDGIYVDFSGSTFNGTTRDMMNAWAEEDFVPGLVEEIRRHRRAWGGD